MTCAPGRIFMRAAVPALSSITASTIPFDEMVSVDIGLVFSTTLCTRPSALTNSISSDKCVFFIHIAAANHDPRLFDRPDELDFERARSSHLAFGAGNHRCLGSNLARMSLSVVFQEVLARMHDIRLVDDDPPRRIAGVGWRVSYLPLVFTPS